MRIGFIGLGGMGQGMAANLLKAGHEVVVWNRSPEPVQGLVAQGARAAASPAEAFETEVVFSILANDAATREVILDSGDYPACQAAALHPERPCCYALCQLIEECNLPSAVDATVFREAHV